VSEAGSQRSAQRHVTRSNISSTRVNSGLTAPRNRPRSEAHFRYTEAYHKTVGPTSARGLSCHSATLTDWLVVNTTVPAGPRGGSVRISSAGGATPFQHSLTSVWLYTRWPVEQPGRSAHLRPLARLGLPASTQSAPSRWESANPGHLGSLEDS